MTALAAMTSALQERRHHRRKGTGPHVDMVVRLRLTPQERERLALQGRVRGFGPLTMARMLLERAIADDLFKAILED